MRRASAVLLWSAAVLAAGCRQDMRVIYHYDLDGADRVREVVLLKAETPAMRFGEMFRLIPGAKLEHPLDLVEPRAREALALIAEHSGVRGHFVDEGKDYLDAAALGSLAPHLTEALGACTPAEVVALRLGSRTIYLRGLQAHGGGYRILQVCGTPKRDAEPDCYGIIVPPSGPLEPLR